MKIDQALKIIDEICVAFKGTRQDHVAIQQAMEAIRVNLVKPAEVETVKEETT